MGSGKTIGVVVLVVCAFIGVWLLLGYYDKVPCSYFDDEDEGWGNSGISEEEWFDSPLGADWTEYTNPDDPTGQPVILLPNDDFESLGSAYYADLNYSNVTDFGGFQLEMGVEESGAIPDAARAMMIVYANLDESAADEDDMIELIDAALEISGDFTLHEDSPMNFTVDGHGQHLAILREGTDPTGDVYAMLAYIYWDCENSDRIYTMLYGVAKNLTCNEWSNRAFYAECEYIFSHVTCHA